MFKYKVKIFLLFILQIIEAYIIPSLYYNFNFNLLYISDVYMSSYLYGFIYTYLAVIYN